LPFVLSLRIPDNTNPLFSLLPNVLTVGILQIQPVALWHAICNILGKTERKGGQKNEDLDLKKNSIHRSRRRAGALRDIRTSSRQSPGRSGGNQISGTFLRTSSGSGNRITRNRAGIHARGCPGVRNHDRNRFLYTGLARGQRARRRACIGKDGCG
jgi:hypothetical protein